jgi:hypothetical protein
MRRFTKKQYLVAGVAAAIIAGTAGSAIAYWSTTGSGSGGAATAGSDTAMTITQSGTITGLTPGSTAAALNVTVANSAVSSQQIGTITATPSYPANCDASNWTVTPTSNGPTTVAGNSSSGVIEVATVALKDLPAVDQNLCKGASVSFTFAG